MGNWIVAGLLAVIVGFIIRYLVKQWKAGHGFCGCGDCKSCGHCPQHSDTGCTGCKECQNKP